MKGLFHVKNYGLGFLAEIGWEYAFENISSSVIIC